MCEKTIEKSGNQAGIAQLDWNRSTKKATLTYDANKTSPKEVLKRVADAGYDNQYYTANDSTYDNLHGCCQYDRIKSPKQEKVACEHKGQKDQACCSGNKNAEKNKSCSTEAKGKSCCSGK